MFIDVLTPFADPLAASVAKDLCESSLGLAPIPGYLLQMKRTLLTVPATCEGVQCSQCASPILRTNTPMDFYDEPHTHTCAQSATSVASYVASYDDIDVDDLEYDDYDEEDALNDYIDYVLDNDYDY